MQTRTVGNIIEALNMGKKDPILLKEIIRFLNKKRKEAINSSDGRKSNTLERKLEKLKELGYEITKEGV
tara:strand:- start:143 stop:349 length:207 start_codon:yes stop_codon:yes gene_type:complete